jgi:hypothetical protein
MNNAIRLAIGTLFLSIAAFTAGCVVAPPNEGYYDRDHHRYYHEHVWVSCGRDDEHCH